jgi:membrane-anchored glycerophosphoryl diester phosphodiesterase (GDPDase)
MEVYSSEVGSVDLSLWYTSDEVYEMAEAYGEEGRQAYIQAWLTFDVIWPIIYMVFLSISISYLFKKIFDKKKQSPPFKFSPVTQFDF